MTLTKKDIENLESAYDSLERLDSLLTERISENNKLAEQNPYPVKQFVHAYMLYREKCWKAKYIIRDILKLK